MRSSGKNAQRHCRNSELLTNIAQLAAVVLGDLIDCLSNLSEYLSHLVGCHLDQRLALSAYVAQFVQSAYDES